MALADAAIIVLAESVKVPGLRRLTEQDGLPPLPPVELVLWQRKHGISAAADHLAHHIEYDVGRSGLGIIGKGNGADAEPMIAGSDGADSRDATIPV